MFTVLGIALKATSLADFRKLIGPDPADVRLAILESLLQEHHDAIKDILQARRNSFTGARRFLVSQVLMAAYFGQHNGYNVNFADFGTGLGIMPRQLNSRSLFELFSKDLIWPAGTPRFAHIPLASRFGVDQGPMPDLQWVHQCYGSSPYYSRLYRELLLTLETPEVKSAKVSYHEIDILDHDSIAQFIRNHRINAVNLCYVLYELEPSRRKAVIDAVRSELSTPGMIIVTEPHGELTQPGCTIELYRPADHAPERICSVSDGHFRGHILPLDDYESFVERYPIHYKDGGAPR